MRFSSNTIYALLSTLIVISCSCAGSKSVEEITLQDKFNSGMQNLEEDQEVEFELVEKDGKTSAENLK